MATVNTGISNCNIKYIDGLNGDADPVKTMRAVVTVMQNNGYDYAGPKIAAFRTPNCGIYLFAQGCEHTHPYAANFAKFITDNGLGAVLDSGPAPNPLHAGKPSRLFMWVIDQMALYKWWQDNVDAPAKAKKKADEDAKKAAKEMEEAAKRAAVVITAPDTVVLNVASSDAIKEALEKRLAMRRASAARRKAAKEDIAAIPHYTIPQYVADMDKQLAADYYYKEYNR